MVIPKVNIEEDIKKLGPSLKISDAVHEARENHNVLVDAINLVLLALRLLKVFVVLGKMLFLILGSQSGKIVNSQKLNSQLLVMSRSCNMSS